MSENIKLHPMCVIPFVFNGEFNKDKLETRIRDYCEVTNSKMGEVMSFLRFALTGSSKGLPTLDIMDLIGKDETYKRIEFCLKKLYSDTAIAICFMIEGRENPLL